MTYQNHTVLAVVPARGGSKSVPRKNLRKVGGISLVGRAAMIATSLPWVDRAIISTDDDEIAREARAFGLEAPFMRPAELAGDDADAIAMWTHAWLASEKHYGCRFDVSLLLEPTSPFREIGDVEAVMHELFSGDYLAAATISQSPGHFTPHKGLLVGEDKLIKFYHEDGEKYIVRQRAPKFYFRNGLCYALKRACLIEKKTILGARCAAVIIERDIVNIDSPIDLEFADFLFQRRVA